MEEVHGQVYYPRSVTVMLVRRGGAGLGWAVLEPGSLGPGPDAPRGSSICAALRGAGRGEAGQELSLAAQPAVGLNWRDPKGGGNSIT